MPISAPPPYLLERLKRLLLGSVFGGPATYDEPTVATFARALVDNKNCLLLSQAQAAQLLTLIGGNAGTAVLSFPIPIGQDFVLVQNMGLPWTPTKCVPTVMIGTGNVNNLTASCRYPTLSSDGFTAQLSGITDTDDYILSCVLS
jgi:hypothetical protein